MTTTTIYNSSQTRAFEFAPITFRVHNAKGFSDYADGIEPDCMVNDQDAESSDDIDYVFPYDPNDWRWWFRDYAVSWAASWIVDGENPEWVNLWYEENGLGDPPVLDISSASASASGTVRSPGAIFTAAAFGEKAVTRSGAQPGEAVDGRKIRNLGSTAVSPVPGRHGAIVHTDRTLALTDSLDLSGTREVADTLLH